MHFITQYDDFVIDNAKVDSKSSFERGSYRSTKTMIEEFINAGKALEAARSEQFDNISDDDEFELDPTRSKNFDLADASAILNKATAAMDELRYTHEEGGDAENKEGADAPIVDNSTDSIAKEALKE